MIPMEKGAGRPRAQEMLATRIKTFQPLTATPAAQGASSLGIAQ
jgi:hypothetical protein